MLHYMMLYVCLFSTCKRMYDPVAPCLVPLQRFVMIFTPVPCGVETRKEHDVCFCFSFFFSFSFSFFHHSGTRNDGTTEHHHHSFPFKAQSGVIIIGHVPPIRVVGRNFRPIFIFVLTCRSFITWVKQTQRECVCEVCEVGRGMGEESKEE